MATVRCFGFTWRFICAPIFLVVVCAAFSVWDLKGIVLVMFISEKFSCVRATFRKRLHNSKKRCAFIQIFRRRRKTCASRKRLALSLRDANSEFPPLP